MRIAVFGVGGVGGLVGGALARNHSDIYFYARGEHLRAIRENGLSVESYNLGSFTAHPKLATDKAEEIGVVDVLFIASKGYDLRGVCKAASPMAGPNTAVIPLLNGGPLSEILEGFLPPCIVADGIIRTHSHIEKPGQIIHETGGTVVFGMRDGSRPLLLSETAALLNTAGIPTTVSEQILVDCWIKYVSMCGNSTIHCWFDADTGGVRETPGYETVLQAIWQELVSVAAAKGIILPGNTVENLVQSYTKASPDTITSLYRDLRNGKPAEQTELFHLIGRILQFGKETGVPTPYHQAVFEKYAS